MKRLRVRAFQPTGCTFLQEGLNALFPFTARANIGNAFYRLRDELGVDFLLGDRVQQFFARAKRVRAGTHQSVGEFGDFGIQRFRAHDFMHKTNAMRFGGIKTLGGQKITVRRACAHRPNHIRTDRRGQQT